MRTLTLLLASLMGLAVTACSGVYSVVPVGDQPVYLEPREWEGLWEISEDDNGDVHVETCGFNVVDAAGGILEIVGPFGPDGEIKTFRAVFRQHTHAGSQASFISTKFSEEINYYYWIKYRHLGNGLIEYRPDVDAFAKLVDKGDLVGEVSHEFGTSVFLDPLTKEQLDRITLDQERQLFDYEFKDATGFPGFYRVSPILADGGIPCTPGPKQGEASSDTTGIVPLHYTITDLGDSATIAINDVRYPPYHRDKSGLYLRDDPEHLAINNAGQVVGSTSTQGKDGNWLDKPFLWTRSSGMTEFGIPEEQSVSPTAISNAGLVAGAHDFGHMEAFMWDSRHGVTDLGTLGGRWSCANSLNDLDQVVGESETPDGQFRAFFWEGGVMSDLGALGGDYSSAQAINQNGQVVGSTFKPTDGFVRPHKAFLWTRSGGMTDLGTLGGIDSEANSINDKGEVVGTSKTVQGYNRAFIWHPDTGMVDLGTLGGRDSSANAINNARQVVGWSEVIWGDTEQRHAFLWDHGNMIDLSALPDVKAAGWSELTEAVDINDQGQIVGFGVRDGKHHIFLLTPEPPLANGH